MTRRPRRTARRPVRRTARRPVRRRTRRRSSGGGGLLFAVFLGLVLAVWVVGTLVRDTWRWLDGHRPILAVLAVALCGAAVVLVRSRVEAGRVRRERLSRLRFTLPEIDAMTPTQFERACADLLRRDGFDADHVGRSNDQAADVIARAADGRIVVVQCKHTTRAAKVGAPVLYAVNGTARPTHGADVVIVATNGGFTVNAREWAPRHGIHLVDREALARWAGEGHALADLLRIGGSAVRGAG